MSRSEWERGEIKMSVKEFGAVRRDMIAFHNQRQTALFESAKSLYTRIKEHGKGKRNFDFMEDFRTMVGTYEYRMSVEGADEIQNILFPYEKVEGKGYIQSRRPKNPQKKQFPMLKQNADRIDVGGEACIGFDKKRRVIIWSVSENNHSVERAHEHSTGREFFKRLSRVVWTRGTGGEIVGNDEYNEDNRESGGAANYTTHRFGVAEKQFKQSFAAARSWR